MQNVYANLPRIPLFKICLPDESRTKVIFVEMIHDTIDVSTFGELSMSTESSCRVCRSNRQIEECEAAKIKMYLNNNTGNHV